jgi:ribosomal protein S15P/S13E
LKWVQLEDVEDAVFEHSAQKYLENIVRLRANLLKYLKRSG